MKTARLLLPLALASATPAMAQTTTTLYGIIDAGVNYLSNQGGHGTWSMDTGLLSPNLFGLRGSEALGSDLKAVFTLEGQFAADNGASVGPLFGRQAYVGLSSTSWGTLTLGKQYDFSFDMLGPGRYGPSFPMIGLYNLRLGPFGGLGVPGMPGGAMDFDGVAGAKRVDNSVKFTSANYGGLTFGALYGFGEQPGSMGQGRTYSAGASYARGPFALTAAITDARNAAINNGSDGIRTWGLGGRYQLGAAVLNALYTNTRNTFTGGSVQVAQVGTTLPVAASTTLLLDYQYQWANATLDKVHAHQASATLGYALSKRTDAYAALVYQRAGGAPGATAWIAGLNGPSDGKTQTLVRLGMRHMF
ncbi:hypothetical protein CDO44_24020 [Pigmentiphaga sp. NML080357]|uniref:porin n=1 Tax=Pigmentiphaga sp. NML080357 TaxID=2008675 RepID=UPI000B40D3C4|nr:porin [Pigmentiphaga sp. NML080357]OVZ55293.1 hypothetical protein CDO44_24020 [Pigmentiphaga sp. NML080357]